MDRRLQPFHDGSFQFLARASPVERINRLAFLVERNVPAGNEILIQTLGNEFRERTLATGMARLRRITIQTRRRILEDELRAPLRMRRFAIASALDIREFCSQLLERNLPILEHGNLLAVTESFPPRLL